MACGSHLAPARPARTTGTTVHHQHPGLPKGVAQWRNIPCNSSAALLQLIAARRPLHRSRLCLLPPHSCLSNHMLSNALRSTLFAHPSPLNTLRSLSAAAVRCQRLNALAVRCQRFCAQQYDASVSVLSSTMPASQCFISCSLRSQSIHTLSSTDDCNAGSQGGRQGHLSVIRRQLAHHWYGSRQGV